MRPRKDEALKNMRKAMSKFLKAWDSFDNHHDRKQKAFFLMKEEYQTMISQSIIDIYSSDSRDVYDEKDLERRKLTPIPWNKHSAHFLRGLLS
jgi:hypothetical protein